MEQKGACRQLRQELGQELGQKLGQELRQEVRKELRASAAVTLTNLKFLSAPVSLSAAFLVIPVRLDLLFCKQLAPNLS